MRPHRIAATLTGLALLSAACTPGTPAPDSTSAPAGTGTPATTQPDETTAERIYRLVGPSVASIDTDIAHGSGVLIDTGLVLTAAHVVWPYRSVRVVFADGAELEEAPVVGWDLFGDLALVDVSGAEDLPPPAALGDGEGIALGRSVYMVGYPGESEQFPQPTITEGILSRVREWEAEQWTFLQSDATVVGGQSGGALVDEHGSVVGITNFSFLEEFGLSGSLSDAAGTIERMRSGLDPSGMGERLPADGAGADTFHLSFENVWEDHVFVFQAPLYADVEFSVTSDADTELTFATIDGLEIASADETISGEERIADLITYPGPHMVRVENYTGAAEARLSASVDIVEWPDPDDGRVLTRNTTTAGNIDYPGDFDWYRIELGKGQAVTIDVDAIAFDPALMVDGPEGEGYFRAVDDDGGGGLFGTNPRIVFTAREAGTFIVVVADGGSTGPGAYRLTVD